MSNGSNQNCNNAKNTRNDTNYNAQDKQPRRQQLKYGEVAAQSDINKVKRGNVAVNSLTQRRDKPLNDNRKQQHIVRIGRHQKRPEE